MAYYHLEPFCGQRGDIRNAQLMAMISNMFRGKTETPVKPMTFMPFLVEEEQTPEQMKAILLASGTGEFIEGS